MNGVRTKPQIAIATFLALAVLVMFVSPLAFGPPAPRQRSVHNVALPAGLAATVVAVESLLAITQRASD